MQELDKYIDKEANKIREKERWPEALHQKARKIVRDRLIGLWKVNRTVIYSWCKQKYIVIEVRGMVEAFKALTDTNKGEIP